MSETPLASVVIPNWNGAHLLPACLDALAAQTYARLEVIVADGASRDHSLLLLAERYPQVRTVRLQRNQGFAGNVNAGLRAARGDVLLLLNNDAAPEPDWVERCVAALHAHPEVAAVACKVLFEDGRTLNSAGDGLTRGGRPFQRGAGQPDGPAWDVPGPVFGAMGGAAAYQRAMLADIGLLDEVYFAYLEDLDLAFRAQLRGWACWYEPTARVYHAGGATGGGPLESYYNGRNLVRLLVKNVPTGLLPAMLPGIVRYQLARARAAAAAWRGAAARATLRGQLAGLLTLSAHVAARGPVQATRRVSDARVYALLDPS